MNETVRKNVRIHLRFMMTKVINRKTSCFFSWSSIFMFSLSWYRRSHWWCQDPFEKVDCINTYGSYNRTCKGDYVRPFQPCKDVNANLTKTNISPLTAQVSRDTQETVMKRNFYHVNLYIDSTGRVSNCSNSNLKGPLGNFVLCSFKSHSYFFLYRVRSFHNTDVRSQLFSWRPNSKLSF